MKASQPLILYDLSHILFYPERHDFPDQFHRQRPTQRKLDRTLGMLVFSQLILKSADAAVSWIKADIALYAGRNAPNFP